MTLYKGKYRVESARRPGWDYSTPGYYFITVCTFDRGYLFGNVSNGEMLLNDFGRIVQIEWDKSFQIRCELIRDEFVVMPNHFHGIVQLVDIEKKCDCENGGVGDVETSGRTSLRGGRGEHNEWKPHHIGRYEYYEQVKNAQSPRLRPRSVSSFMAGVKSVITRKINEIRTTPGAHVLQYRFHDHVIRNEQELFRIRNYIRNNPINWGNDKFNRADVNRVQEIVESYEEESWMT